MLRPQDESSVDRSTSNTRSPTSGKTMVTVGPPWSVSTRHVSDAVDGRVATGRPGARTRERRPSSRRSASESPKRRSDRPRRRSAGGPARGHEPRRKTPSSARRYSARHPQVPRQCHLILSRAALDRVTQNDRMDCTEKLTASGRGLWGYHQATYALSTVTEVWRARRSDRTRLRERHVLSFQIDGGQPDRRSFDTTEKRRDIPCLQHLRSIGG